MPSSPSDEPPRLGSSFSRPHCVLVASSRKSQRSHSYRLHKSKSIQKGLGIFFPKILSDPIAPNTMEQLCQPLLLAVNPINAIYIFLSRLDFIRASPVVNKVKQSIWMQVHYASNMSGVNHAPFLQIPAPRYSKRKYRKQKRKNRDKETGTGAFCCKTEKHVSGTRFLTPIACVMKSAEMYINCGILG